MNSITAFADDFEPFLLTMGKDSDTVLNHTSNMQRGLPASAFALPLCFRVCVKEGV